MQAQAEERLADAVQQLQDAGKMADASAEQADELKEDAQRQTHAAVSDLHAAVSCLCLHYESAQHASEAFAGNVHNAVLRFRSLQQRTASLLGTAQHAVAGTEVDQVVGKGPEIDAFDRLDGMENVQGGNA
jgi:hypothetical protein